MNVVVLSFGLGAEVGRGRVEDQRVECHGVT